MSDKPKRTISEEQRKKMADGRKKAMEKRKDEKAQKDKQKDIELKQELEVLRAQKDQMEAKAITKENRKKFRDKMRSKSVTFDKEEEPLPVIEEESLALDASPEPESPREPDESPRDLDSDQKLVRDEKMFKEHVEKLANNANPETKKVFSKITSTYDNNVDITTNLRNMASELKLLIASNVEQIKTNNKVISESKPVREIHQPTFEEIRTEQKYESQLASLMRLR